MIALPDMAGRCAVRAAMKRPLNGRELQPLAGLVAAMDGARQPTWTLGRGRAARADEQGPAGQGKDTE